MSGMVLKRSTVRNGLVAGTTFAVCIVLILPTAGAVIAARGFWDDVTQRVVAISVLVSVLLALELGRANFRLPVAILYSWTFVFFGLAPAVQIAQRKYPWDISTSQAELGNTLNLILLGILAATFGVAWADYRYRSDLLAQPSLEVQRAQTRRLKAAVRGMSIGYAAVGSMFALAMGPALFQGRAVYRVRLLEVASVPFGASLVFLASAGAIIVPAVLIVSQRSKVRVGRFQMTVVMCVALVASNPLFGSRFLTGSSVLAIVGAMVIGRFPSRLLPIFSIVLLVLVFPTTDVLRGDGSGSAEVAILDPEVALLSPDFDAFEMALRAVNLDAYERGELPSRLSLTSAPLLRWVPIASRSIIDLSTGPLVAEATGMQYTYVSMPLLAEGYVLGGLLGSVGIMAFAGYGLAKLSSKYPTDAGHIGQTVTSVVAAALLFIVLRGPLFEVLGYLLLAWIVGRRLTSVVGKAMPREQALVERFEDGIARPDSGVLPPAVSRHP